MLEYVFYSYFGLIYYICYVYYSTCFILGLSIEFNLDFKTKKNWVFGVNGSYIFGKDVKESLFDSISTASGSIIDGNGQFADVRLYERGFTASVSAGRLFAFKKPNPNSGVLFSVGVGFIQHKIRIETIGNTTPQLSKEYKKGYELFIRDVVPAKENVFQNELLAVFGRLLFQALKK